MSDKSEIVDRKSAELGEHFESVLILVTWHDGNNSVTRSYEKSLGNIYAQLGQAREWLAIQDEVARLEARHRDAKDKNE